MGGRRLKPEEIDLWRQVARTATPIDHGRPAPEPAPDVSQRPDPPTPKAPDPITPFKLGEKAGKDGTPHDVLPGLADRMRRQPVAMDRKAHARLKRGKLAPEARIDLHGMTAERAHGALSGFIHRAHGQRKRLVLVITGKGRQGAADAGPMPVRRGVLRHNVPHWLSLPPLAGMVMQVTNAHPRHGGDGAYYVYLRRPR